jgi:hypothetical protein
MPDNPIPYPLDPVSVSGTLITLDQYVENPTVITRRVAEIAAQRFYAHKIFSAGPEVTGGAILFERPNPLLTDLYAGRRTQEMAPGTVGAAAHVRARRPDGRHCPARSAASSS